MASTKKGSFLSQTLGFWGKGARLEREKARLEAFLSAVPGEYCGWADDKTFVYSRGFCDLIGVSEITSMQDIQGRLGPSDSAAMEGFINRLERSGTAFTLQARNYEDSKYFKITGRRGESAEHTDSFHVLWLQDISEEIEEQKAYQQEKQEQEEQSNSQYEFLNALPRSLWVRDENQKIIWCNARYAETLGETAEKIIEEQIELTPQPKGKTANPEAEGTPGPSLARKAMKAKNICNTKAHVISSGVRRFKHIYEAPILDGKHTIGMALDITREEELEIEIKRRRQATRSLLEQLPTSIGIFREDESLDFYNTAFSQLWGLEGGWLNTRPRLGEIMEKLREIRKLPEQVDFKSFKQSWLDMFTDLIEPHDDMLYLPDGSVLRMLVIPHDLGGVMMTFDDVTSNIELESSYNTLIAVQKETLDNLGEAVAVYGANGLLQLHNPAFARLWNLHPEDLEGSPHISSISEKMKAFFEEEQWDRQRQELISKGLDRIMHEGRLECANDMLIDFTTVPLPDGGVLITYIDVTDSVRVENALREKNAALETAEKLKMDFLANVSYQLRTPLNAIMGFTEILDQQYFGPMNKRQLQYTHDMKNAGQRLLNLINDILDLSSIEAGQLTLEYGQVKIYTMLESVADLMSEWARKKQISIDFTCPKNIGSLEADETRIKQILVNVTRNAISYTPAGGRITLSGKRLKDGVQLTVTDTGIGISQEDQKRIFEPFERSGRIQNVEARGAGLGLTLVKNIVTLHEGDIEIESKPGEGSMFRIFLPFERSEPIEDTFQKLVGF